MKKAEKELQKMLYVSSKKGIQHSIQQRNPNLAAQFNIQAELKIFQGALSATVIPGTSLPSVLQRNFPFPIFGSYDAASNYSYFAETSGLKRPSTTASLNLNKWFPVYMDFVKLSSNTFPLGSFFNAAAVNYFDKAGDFGIIFSGIVTGGAPTDEYMAAIKISVNEVGYGSIVSAINSDVFYFNKMQFSFESDSLNQYNVPLNIVRQSIFGKGKSEQNTFGTFKSPGEFQSKIIDVPIKELMTKYILWIYAFDFRTTLMNFNFYVNYINKKQIIK
jgi:hypothetical protein